MKCLRIAVLGGGHLGKIHARILQSIPDVELIGVVEPHPAARAEVTRVTGAPSFDDLTSIPGSLDAAIVATPTQFHADLASQLLGQGIHTFVEKPLCTTSFEARQLTRLAASHGCVLQVGHVEAFNPAVCQVPSDLLPPMWIHATRQGPYTFRSTDISVILDLMIHDLDLILHWQQSPVIDVEATGYAVLGDLVDVAQARLYFANGAIAQLFASRVSPHRERSMQILSNQGAARIDFAENRLQLTRPTELARATLEDPVQRGTLQQDLFTKVLPTHDFSTREANPIRDELTDFVHAIRTGTAPRVSGERATQAIDIAERITASLRHSTWQAAPGRCQQAA